MTGKDTIRFARDLGSPHTVEVSGDFLNPTYLRIVLLVQILLWFITIYSVFMIFHLFRAEGYQKYALLAFSIPALWMYFGYIHDAVLTQFFLSVGFYFFFLSLRNGLSAPTLMVAGINFSLAALSRATFQLLPFMFALSISIPVLYTLGRKGVLRLAFFFVLPPVLILGGWSLRNYQKAGTFSTSSAMGPILCSQTARFVDRASSSFPEIVPSLVSIRNERGRVWGAKAVNYLVVQRGMSYAEANRLLLKVNLVAILHAPFLYLSEVARSIISFHLPQAPKGMNNIRAVSLILDAILIASFFLTTGLWCFAHLLGWISPISKRLVWTDKDTLLLGALTLYWYTAGVTCAVDFAGPEHRAPVQFILPLVILIAASRLDMDLRKPRRLVQSRSSLKKSVQLSV